MRLRAGRHVGDRTAAAAHAVSFLGARLFDGGSRARRHAILDWFEFALGVGGQEYAATFIERFSVRSARKE